MRNVTFWLWGPIPLVLLILGGSLAIAQEVDQRVLENAATEIRKKNQSVSEELLARDRSVIEAAYPTIKQNLSMKGFSSAEVNHAVVTNWKKVRLETGGSFLNEQVFRMQVSKLGMLEIESEPRDAAIEINASVQDERTNTKAWLAPGTYRIVIIKPGYFPAEEHRRIVEGKNPPLKKRLKLQLK